MTQETIIAGIVGAAVACAGLWWFRLMLPAMKKQPKATRFGVYALIWLAYFILTVILLSRRGG